MTAVDSLGLAIGVRERYHDVVSQKWPVIVTPQHDELLQVSCVTHRGGLRDRCPSCHSRIAVFDQTELVPQHYCVCCGFDLRRASKVPMSLPATRLDRCISDICRLEAITGSLCSGMLVQRLLRIPSISGSFPTASLSSLSTSMRIRCVERLADRPTDWLTADEDAVAGHWRRSILLAGGHGPLMAQHADALKQKRQRHPRADRRLPTAELSALLGAYVRMMEGPRRRRTRHQARGIQDDDASGSGSST